MVSKLILCTHLLIHVVALASYEDPEESISAPCDQDGLRMDTLSQSSHWSIVFESEHLNKCLVPDGYEASLISSCSLHFSFCGRTVPKDICRGHANSTICQEVVTTDGLRHYFNVGDNHGHRENGVLKPTGYHSSDGSFTIRHEGFVSNRFCTDQYKISLKFVCDLNMAWNPLSHDASPHVLVIEQGDDPCYLEIIFGYSGACHSQATPSVAAPTLSTAEDDCVFPPYNLTGLKSRDYWFADVRADYCYNNYYGEMVKCRLNFTFCRALPDSATDKWHPNCNGAAVCQTATTKDPLYIYHHFYYSMGQYKGHTKFFSSEYPGGGFHMRVSHGTIPGCLDGRTRVVLKCNSTAEWVSQNLTDMIQVETEDHCEYKLILPYKGACFPPNITVAPSIMPATVVPPSVTTHQVSHTTVAPTPSPAPDGCSLPPYNLTQLKSRDYWFARVNGDVCYYDRSYYTLLTCTLNFSFCGALPPSPGCNRAAACQTVVVEDPIFHPHSFTYSMGRYVKGRTKFSYNENLAGGGFHVDVDNGTSLPECRNVGVKTRIILTCNSTVEWVSQDLSRIIQVKTEGPCEYTITLPYQGACLPLFPNATVSRSTAHIPASTMTTSSATHPAANSTTVHPFPTSTSKTPSVPIVTINTSVVHPTSVHKQSTVHIITSSTSSSIVHPTSVHKQSTVHTILLSTSSSVVHPTSVHKPSTIHTVTSSTSSSSLTTTTSMSVHATSAAAPSKAPSPTAQPARSGDLDEIVIIALAVGLGILAILSVILIVSIVIIVCKLRKKHERLKFITSQ